MITTVMLCFYKIDVRNNTIFKEITMNSRGRLFNWCRFSVIAIALAAAGWLLPRSAAGELDKLGIGTRLLRAKAEGPEGDDGYRVAPTTGQVPYTCVRIKLPWEIS